MWLYIYSFASRFTSSVLKMFPVDNKSNNYDSEHFEMRDMLWREFAKEDGEKSRRYGSVTPELTNDGKMSSPILKELAAAALAFRLNRRQIQNLDVPQSCKQLVLQQWNRMR